MLLVPYLWASMTFLPKISSLINASRPKNVSEGGSFLGLAQYLARFIKDFCSNPSTYTLQELSKDLCGPFPSGDYLLVVIDDFSRYPEVEILR